MAEEWRAIGGYEGLYQVSSLGRVRSLSYRSTFATIPRLLILKPSVGRRNNKYLHVTLHRGGIGSRAWVHQLVLEAFVGICPSGHEAAHGDGDSRNNALSNLSWKTRQENAQDRIRHGTQTRGETNGWSTLTTEQVRTIRSLVSQGSTFSAIARQIGISLGHVSRIAHRKAWAHVS